MINPNAYYTVQAWMVNDLGLHGNELALYAIIYGFSQDGHSEFAGSLTYIMEWLGCTKHTAIKAINGLAEKGLIIKKKNTNGIDTNTYKAIIKDISCSAKNAPGVVQFLDGGSAKNAPGVVQFLDGGSAKNAPNNYIYNNYNNYTDKEYIGDADAPPTPPVVKEEKKKDENEAKHKYGEYNNVLLTDAEYKKLQGIYSDLPARIERLSEYIASTGKKYKSHYATIRSWANRDKQQPQPYRTAGRYQATGTVGPNGIHIDPSKNDLDKFFR